MRGGKYLYVQHLTAGKLTIATLSVGWRVTATKMYGIFELYMPCCLCTRGGSVRPRTGALYTTTSRPYLMFAIQEESQGGLQDDKWKTLEGSAFIARESQFPGHYVIGVRGDTGAGKGAPAGQASRCPMLHLVSPSQHATWRLGATG